MSSGIWRQIANHYAKHPSRVLLSLIFAAGIVIGVALIPATATGPDDTTSNVAANRLLLFQVGAWMPTSWDTDAAWDSFRTNKDRMHTLSPFWYHVAEDGTLKPMRGARDQALIAEAREAGLTVIPTIANSYNRALIHTILSDEALATRHRLAIVREVVENNYDGIDIDYENLGPDDKDAFSAWIAALADDLHARGKLLSVTVQPKTFDADGWGGPGALDYQSLGESADEIRIMAYGWCWASGCVGTGAPPGPISPLHWEQGVIRYAKTKVPARKLVLGLHLYGYDWPLPTPEEVEIPAEATAPAGESWCAAGGCADNLPPGPMTVQAWMQWVFNYRPPAEQKPVAGPPTEQEWIASLQRLAAAAPDKTAMRGKALVWRQADALMKEHNVEMQWWPENDRGEVGEPWFTYADETHAVTFANAESVTMRVNLAREEGLRGVFFWRPGGEDPGIWEGLPQRHYQIYKWHR